MFGLERRRASEREIECGKRVYKETENKSLHLSAVHHTALSSVSMSEAQREYGAGLQRGGWRVFTLFFSNKKEKA